jgi:hypothetical protein
MVCILLKTIGGFLVIAEADEEKSQQRNRLAGAFWLLGMGVFRKWNTSMIA